MYKKFKHTTDILFVILLASSWTNFVKMSHYKITVDYQLFEKAGIGNVFLMMGVVLVVLEVMAAYFIRKPKKTGIRLATSALVISLINSLISYAILFQNLDFARDTYRASREARGMSMDEEFLAFIFSPNGMRTIILAGLVWTIFVIYLLWRANTYLKDKA